MMLFNQHFHFSKLHTPAAFELVVDKIRQYWTPQSEVLIYLEDMQYGKVSGLDRIAKEHSLLKQHITECLYTDQSSRTQPIRYIGNLKGNYEQVQGTFDIDLTMIRAIFSGIPHRYPLEYASVHIKCLNFGNLEESRFFKLQDLINGYNNQIRNKFCSWGLDMTVGSMIKFHSDYYPSRRSLWCEVMMCKDKITKKENPLPIELTAKIPNHWHPLRRKLVDVTDLLNDNRNTMDEEEKFAERGLRSFHDFRLPYA